MLFCQFKLIINDFEQAVIKNNIKLELLEIKDW